MQDVLVLACSPRKGGNTDFAAGLVCGRLGGRARAVRVADSGVKPCMSCGFCTDRPGSCALGGDGASLLLEEMLSSRVVVFVSPVYFYHVPAQAKALADRVQRWWAVSADRLPGRGRVMTAVLAGARLQGEKLFEGSLLTLRHVAAGLGMEWRDGLCLRGLDGPDDLRRDEAGISSVLGFASALAAEFPARGGA